MNITKNTVVTINYRVVDTEEKEVDPGSLPIVYLHGDYDDIFPRIEEALEGKTVGDEIVVKLLPEEAFGEYEPELIRVEPIEEMPEGLQVGMQIEGTPIDGNEDETMIYVVTDIGQGKAVLDGNHPLAGVALVFTCAVAAVREATPEEVAHGHAHGPDGKDCH